MDILNRLYLVMEYFMRGKIQRRFRNWRLLRLAKKEDPFTYL